MELSQVLQALRNADAAGDVEGARRLAQIAQQLSSQQPTPAQPAQDTTGFKAAAAAGFERLKGETALTAGKLGLMDEAAAEKYQKEKEAAAEKRFTPTQDGWTESPWQKFKETAGGSVPYMAAPVVAGLGALAAPAAVPAAALGAGLAGLASAGQFTGSNLARQMDTGKTLGETSLGSAVAAAIPQAALDTAAMALMPGVGKLFGSVGAKLTTAQAEAIAKQTLGRAAADYAAKTGVAMGREGLTETAQQVLERVQAGLSITDPEARKEYIDSFIGGAALAGVGAPAGRYIERSAAKTQAGEAQQARIREKRIADEAVAKEEAAAKEAEKQTPEYALRVEQDYLAAEQQKADLKAQIKKGTKEAPLNEADKAFNADINAQLKELQPTVKELGQEFNRTAKVRAQAQEQARVDAMSPEDFMLEQTMRGEGVQATGRAAGDRGALFEREAAPVAPVDTSVQDYATGQIEAARSMGALGVDDYVGFLMQNPTMADQMVKTRTKMPDLTRQENETVLGALKLQLKAREKSEQAQRAAASAQLQATGQQRIAGVEEEEQAVLAQADAERQAAAQEAQREAGLGGERFALQKMRAAQGAPQSVFDETAPYSLGPKLSDQFGLFGTEQAPPTEGVAPMGQMRQKLLGEDVTFTAEEEKKRDLRRVPGADLKLRARAEGTGAPVTRDELADRINTVLSTYELSPEAADLLQRVERALPQKLLPEYAQALDEQLTLIESGQEGVPRKGADRPATLQALAAQGARAETAAPTKAYKYETQSMRSAQPGQAQTSGRRATQPEGERVSTEAGETPVEKRVSGITPKTLRGESAAPAPLSSLEADRRKERSPLGELLRTAEAAAAEDAGQMGLFPAEEKKLGTIKESPEALRRVQDAPTARKARKEAREAEAAKKQQTPAQKARAEQGANEAELLQYKRDLSDARAKYTNDVLEQQRTFAERADEIAAATGQARIRRVRALTELERDAREKGLTADAAQGVQYKNALYNKDAGWLLREIGKVEKRLRELTDQVKAAKKKSASYTGDAAMVMAFKGQASAIRAQSRLAVQLEALNNAYDLRKGAAQPRVTEAKRVAEKERERPEERDEVEAEIERAQTFGVRKERLDLLKEKLAVAKKDGTEKSVRRLSEAVIKAEAELAEVAPQKLQGKVTQASRVQTSAPGKLRTGTEESKKATGATKRPVVEGRNEKLPTAKQVMAEGNIAALLKQASEKPKTVDELKTLSMEQDRAVTAAQQKLVDDLRIQKNKLEEEVSALQALQAKGPTRITAETLKTKSQQLQQVTTAFKRAGKNLKTYYNATVVSKKVSDVEGTEMYGTPSRTMKLFDEDEGGFLFSVGRPEQGLTSTELRTELDKAVGDENVFGKKVSVFETVQEFLDAEPSYDGKIPYDAKGFVDPKTGRAYLFAENIAKGEGLGILLHEVGVHLGFRNFFNTAQFNAIAKTVRNWADAPANTVEGKIGRAAEKRAKDAGTTAEQMDDELIAYAVEEAVKAGIEPAGVKGGSAVANWLRMIVNAFNKALETLGLAPEKLKVGDLVNMAYGAAQLELKGTWHGTGKLFKEFDHTYMGSGEGAQAFSWGTHRADTTGVAGTYQSLGARKQMQAWLQQPEIVAWMDSQKPRYEGKTAEDFAKFAADGKPGESLAGVPFELATGMQQSLEAYAKELAEGGAYPLTPADALKLRLRSRLRGGRALREWAETADMSKASAPHPDPLYKGRRGYMLDSTVEGDVARDILRFIEFPDVHGLDAAQPPKELIKVAAELARTEYAETAAYDGTLSYFKKQVKEAKAKLKVLDNLDLADVTYNPPAPAPLPRPTGNMLRTLHGRKESEYLQWDLSEDKQPPVVAKALKAAVDRLSDRERAKYDAVLAPLVNAKRSLAGRDVYGALGAALESERAASELLHSLGVAGTKFLDGPSRKRPVTNKSTYNYVDYADKDAGAAIMGADLEPVGPAEGLLFSRKTPKYATDKLAAAGNTAGKVIAGQRGFTETIKEEGLGMGLATRLVDRFAPLEKASKLMDSLKGTQMMYYARMFDQKMHFLSQAVSNGAIGLEKKTRADGREEWVVESKEGASIKGVVDMLKDAKDIVGSADGVSQLFSLYTVAKRAERVGLNKMNFGNAVTQAELDSAMKAIKDTPGLAKIFEDARQEYNAFNKGMVQFAVDTGALPKDVAATLLKSDDYVPFYRERNGGVEMVLGNETIAKIGNLKNQPYLKELVGGEDRIIDFMTSSVQNANMLTDMALRNLSTKSAAFELRDIGMAKIGKGVASGTNVVNFKDKGEDYHAVLNTTDAGFPAELLVKGMEGIPYQTTWLTKGLGIPAKLLRKTVTLNPMYAARQLFRDSLAAPILSGANFSPIMGALKEINGTAGKTLERRGITGGQVFTGTQEDLSDTLRRLSAGESGWLQGISKLEALSMEADALTRRAQYNSYIQQGLSEMEATYAALESMNFSKRGSSPAMHFLSTVIPFFNAQVQSMNVLYKAFTGDMPFNEKLKVREKLIQRGLVLAAGTMAYAALMQDDETYKNATPEQKYGNWFIHVPGFDEAVKLPIPFEIGYIFKALPEALVNMMAKEDGGEEALKAFKQIVLQTVPGGSSYGIPQAIKPLIEVGLGKSFYTGRDLESAHEQSMVPGKRTRENTTDFARTVGDMFNVSPIKIDALIQGYTSSTGLALVQALSFAIPTPPSPDKAALRASEMPLVGGLFQPKDAGGVINAAYERMTEAKQVKTTFDGLMEKGRTEEAREFLQENLDKFANAGLATNFTSTMQKLAQAERAVRASNASPEAKRAQLDQIKQTKIKIAEAVRAVGRTTPQ